MIELFNVSKVKLTTTQVSKHHYKELQKFNNTHIFEPSVNTLQCINNKQQTLILP